MPKTRYAMSYAILTERAGVNLFLCDECLYIDFFFSKWCSSQ